MNSSLTRNHTLTFALLSARKALPNFKALKTNNYCSLQDLHSFELFAEVYNVSTPKLTLSDGLSSSANFLPQMLLPLLPVPVLNNYSSQSRTEVNQ